MQLPAKQLGWVTGPLGSNPSLSVKILFVTKFLRSLNERGAATSGTASERTWNVNVILRQAV